MRAFGNLQLCGPFIWFGILYHNYEMCFKYQTDSLFSTMHVNLWFDFVLMLHIIQGVSECCMSKYNMYFGPPCILIIQL